jgi:Protein of unknown function (DUF2442)
MTEIINVTEVEHLAGLRIRATFSDGAVKEIDLSDLIDSGGVFAPIRERREVFEQVHVNPDTRTVEWPNEVDLDSEVLYGLFEPASGVRIERRTVREPAQTAH